MSVVINGTSGITSPDFEGPTVGVTDGSNAAAGEVGEYIESVIASGSAVALTSSVAANVTSISLTAGDWDVSGNVVFATGATTTVSRTYGGVTTTSATADNTKSSNTFYNGVTINTSASGVLIQAVPTSRVSIASTTTVYLIALAGFGVSTCSAYGRISARRVR